MRRVSAPDLVGFPPQRQGDDDQVAGGALNQGRARAGPVLADDQVAFPVTRDFPIRNVRALINQPHPNNGGFAPACGGFLAHPPARGQAYAVLDERLLGVGVDPRVYRLVANRVALSIGRSIHGGQCATRLLTQAPADLAGECAPETNQQSHGREGPRHNPTGASSGDAWPRGLPCRLPRPGTARQGPYGGRSHGTPPRGYAQSCERYASWTSPHSPPP